MGSSTLLIALTVLVIGGYVGWHARHAYGANADLKVHKARIPNFRRVRNNSWLTMAAAVVLTVLVLRALFK